MMRIVYFLLLFGGSISALTLESSHLVYGDAKHAAFTDLIFFGGRWILSFREGEGHVGGGTIRLIESNDGVSWTTLKTFAEERIDLRDPKLSETPDGRLMLLMEQVEYDGEKKYVVRQPEVAFSHDGKNWTSFTPITEPHEWLWRVAWYEGVAYGVSYRTDKPGWEATLWKSHDGVNFTKLVPLNIPSYPSEATVRFRKDGTMIILLRRHKNAWIGMSPAPYTDWSWHDSGMHLGGPDFLIMPDDTMWAAGREVIDKKEKVIVAKMTLNSLDKVLELPSGGDDTSYPGIVYKDGFLWISYYSSHENNQSKIYLAKVKI